MTGAGGPRPQGDPVQPAPGSPGHVQFTAGARRVRSPCSWQRGPAADPASPDHRVSPSSRLHGRLEGAHRAVHKRSSPSFLRPPAGGQQTTPHWSTRRGVSPPPGGRWPRSRHEGSQRKPSGCGGPWPLDVMKQHPHLTLQGPPTQPPPGLLPSPHLNRNTWDVLTPHGRVSGPSGSPQCAELAGRTLCLRSSDGRRRSSTLRTEREREGTALSASRRGWRVAGDAGDSVHRRTGPLWPRAELPPLSWGAAGSRPPGSPSVLAEGTSQPPGTPRGLGFRL